MSQTVEMNLSRLTELLRMSKSLVFVPDRATAKVVRKACHALGLPCLLSDDHPVSQIRNFERDKENFATICVITGMTTGYHYLADQVIWVGPVPWLAGDEGESYLTYSHAVCRASPNAVVHTLENWGRPS